MFSHRFTYIPKKINFSVTKRQCHVGGIMVWGMALQLLGYLKEEQDAGNIYIKTLKTFGVPIMKPNIKHKTGLVQDNCRINIANVTMEFFKIQDLNLIARPSNYPDLNLMKNIWKILCDIIYSVFSQKISKNCRGNYLRQSTS